MHPVEPGVLTRWFAITPHLLEPKDLETWLEVGAWTWNWMEVSGGLIFDCLNECMAG